MSTHGHETVGLATVALATVVVVAGAVTGAWHTRRYLREIRRGNRARGIACHAHRYVVGRTPLRFTWQAMSLSAMAERLGSTRFARGLSAA